MSPYNRPTTNTWWLKRTPYVLFMIREITSVFVAAYCVFLLILFFKLGQGASSYENFISILKSPLSIGLHLISLSFVLYHTVTWFNLTPKILVLYKGEDRVPQSLVAGAFYIGWLIVSVTILWLVCGI